MKIAHQIVNFKSNKIIGEIILQFFSQLSAQSWVFNGTASASHFRHKQTKKQTKIKTKITSHFQNEYSIFSRIFFQLFFCLLCSWSARFVWKTTGFFLFPFFFHKLESMFIVGCFRDFVSAILFLHQWRKSLTVIREWLHRLFLFWKQAKPNTKNNCSQNFLNLN